jgi:hypothetical protein
MGLLFAQAATWRLDFDAGENGAAITDGPSDQITAARREPVADPLPVRAFTLTDLISEKRDGGSKFLADRESDLGLDTGFGLHER